MRPTTYADIKALAFRKAGYARRKAAPADAEDFRDAMLDNLEAVWVREAWPELCNDFEAVTIANGQFAKNDDTKGDVLSLYVGGNPQTTTVVTRVTDWVETDGAVRVNTPTGETTIYVEYQDPLPTLPDFDDAALDDTELPMRFKMPLACLCAADLIENEDPIEADRLRARADQELKSQAAQLSRPWWRGGQMKL